MRLACLDLKLRHPRLLACCECDHRKDLPPHLRDFLLIAHSRNFYCRYGKQEIRISVSDAPDVPNDVNSAPVRMNFRHLVFGRVFHA